MRAFVIGFPKSGTSSIHKAVEESGLKSAHWKDGDTPVGELIYKGHFERDDPLAFVGHYDCIAQSDICIPEAGWNYWPNLDIPLLKRIRELHPECVFILNVRNVSELASSIERWNNLQSRIVASDIPGLPRGFGRTREQLERWIQLHYATCRSVFSGDANFLELDIQAPNAREQLSAALGIEIRWWGRANENTQQDSSWHADVVSSVRRKIRRLSWRFVGGKA